MKRKNWIALLVMAMSLTFMGAFAACGDASSSGDDTGSNSVSNTGGEVTHTHSLTKVNEQSATCTQDGVQEHYTCDGCEKIFADAAGQTETTLDALKIAAGHTLKTVDGKPATCTEDGYEAHYACEECNKVFVDEAGQTETTLDALKIAAKHVYVEQTGTEATYFEEGVKTHYTCENCEDKFLKDGDTYTAVSDDALVIAKQTIADETTAAEVDTNSSDLINTIVADKVKQFDQAQPTYVKINGADGQETQAIYFSRTTAWDVAADADNNCGFVEFRIPVNANCGGISLAYKMLDNNNEVCESVSEEDKAYGMKSYIEYKMNGKYVNVSKEIVGNNCFIADGDWHTFELDCNQKNVEYIIIKIYHFEGELAVTNMQTLQAKHIHELVEVPEQAETCTQDGNTTYYTCDCGKFFADAAATEEIAENSWVLPAHHTMSQTLEYDEENHFYACQKCDYKDATAHTMNKVDDGMDRIGVERTACDCGYLLETAIENPTLDFTTNIYGANVFSVEANAAFSDRTVATADTLKYILYHDNNVVQALHKISLPRMDFARLNAVTITVLLETFAWNQQYGLEENELTNISDTYIPSANHTGTLTFGMVDGTLYMTLQMNGKKLVKTITDENIINGKASAYFYAQAYYDRNVVLSNFTFGGVVAIPDDGRFAAGYATVTDVKYDANKYITSLAMNIPHNVDWWVSSPVLTETYLNTLYAAGIRKVGFNVTSTTTTNNFIVVYNGEADYNAANASIEIKENKGDLQFSYVNLNNDGKTVGTTLTITLSYYVDPQMYADEIGITLASGVNMTKDAEGVYTLSNMNGYQKGAYFTAEQVNAWLAAGYTKLSLHAEFTPSDNIDQVVGYTTSLSFFTNESGSVDWTIDLKEGEAIDFWVQKEGRVSKGAFTISQVVLS